MNRILPGVLSAALAFAPLAAAAPTPPDQVVKTATQNLQTVIKTRHAEFQADRAKFYKVVDEMVAPHFDLKYITQMILGKHGKGASPEQKTRFQAAFKDMLIRSYGNALLEYGGQVTTEWQPLRVGEATDVTVQSKVIRPSGPAVPLGFAMRLNGEQWQIYDITIEGLSLITGFRSQVASEIKKSSLDAVIQKLESGGKLGPA